ncbi:MAG: hypothetical protein SYC29_13465 [Planctomycetota bacterium]|nr:hypothetical protein [Planctomycetota bacterium]
MVLVLLIGLLAATAWTAAFALGALLVWRGLRGRLIDHDPRCRNCGYNLVASPHRPGLCPECGAQIYGLGTIRLGARRRRRSLIILGAAIMLLCLCPIGLSLVGESATSAAAPPRPATPPAPIAGFSPAVVVQESLFADLPSLPAPEQTDATPADAEPGPDEASVEDDDANPTPDPQVDPEPRWYRLHTINGCCPHCGHPVGPIGRSPNCTACGRNIAE